MTSDINLFQKIESLVMITQCDIKNMIPKTLLINALILSGILAASCNLMAQKKVAITIDDVPNTLLYENDKYESVLLNRIDSLQVPVAIYINEGLIFQTDSLSKNMILLDQWIKSDLTTLGNHTFNHSRYSITGLKGYMIEIIKGEAITRELARKQNKELVHFRFPYNDLGKDSTQQAEIKAFLNKYNYRISPFTIESSDWIYNAVYEFYLNNNQHGKAQDIGNKYVNKTMQYFDYFENLSHKKFDRNINQVYLCHDNALNRDYLPALIKRLEARNYEFISLDEALKDEVYQSPNYYHKKWGFSWFYRWMSDKEERKNMLHSEPSTDDIYKQYQRIVKM